MTRDRCPTCGADVPTEQPTHAFEEGDEIGVCRWCGDPLSDPSHPQAS